MDVDKIEVAAVVVDLGSYDQTSKFFTCKKNILDLNLSQKQDNSFKNGAYQLRDGTQNSAFLYTLISFEINKQLHKMLSS